MCASVGYIYNGRVKYNETCVRASPRCVWGAAVDGPRIHAPQTYRALYTPLLPKDFVPSPHLPSHLAQRTNRTNVRTLYSTQIVLIRIAPFLPFLVLAGTLGFFFFVALRSLIINTGKKVNERKLQYCHHFAQHGRKPSFAMAL